MRERQTSAGRSRRLNRAVNRAMNRAAMARFRSGDFRPPQYRAFVRGFPLGLPAGTAARCGIEERTRRVRIRMTAQERGHEEDLRAFTRTGERGEQA